MAKNLYIVPYDFTPVADKALEYALFLGKKYPAEIKLLHIAADKSSGMSKVKPLEAVVNKITIPDGVEVTTYITVGDIFTSIGSIAKKEKAQLVIMGTHGMKGFQRVSGSYAMKVIQSAETPFLIVQKNTEVKDIDKIAVPVDLTKESLQIVNVAGDIANIFNSTIHVLAEEQTDDVYKSKIIHRTGIVSQQYEDRDISAKMHYVKGSGGYGKKIMQFVKKNDVGMIAISYHSESILPQFDSFAQNLITNKSLLPVLVINSKLASVLYF